MIWRQFNGILRNSLVKKPFSISSLQQRRSIFVKPIPALSDNYMYLLVDERSKDAAVIDPIEPDKAEGAVNDHGVNLKMIITTHHHWDHAGGNEEMVRRFLGIPVWGGDKRIDALTNQISHGDKFQLGELQVKCLFTPCHTSGHMSYFVEDPLKNERVLFSGDTLFVGSCGRFFEGTPKQMYESLVKLAALPDDTLVFCGHEYALSNLKFAASIEPDNPDVAAKLRWVQNRSCTVPSSIGDEKKFNPFMRVDQPALRKYAGTDDPVMVMKILRAHKDKF